ncbi:MAG: peptide chain release factor N(5)-glutamine methyltransferase, partial [Lachnospiraceae bacterium]|nr:peptide chain release factor N(5)-glutamine methyltransferase [Lachnospiraceae bacterium]
ELLVEKAGEHLPPQARVLDLCTGSGCVLISLMRLFDGIEGIGVDISEEAIAVARENGRRNFVHPIWRQGDLYKPVKGERFDMIVSNPPYIPTGAIEHLMPEVRDHEPRRALDGGEDGLLFFREIIRDAPLYLKEGGWILFEVGVDEALAVESMLFDRGFGSIRHYRDYADNDRVVRGRWLAER